MCTGSTSLNRRTYLFDPSSLRKYRGLPQFNGIISPHGLLDPHVHLLKDPKELHSVKGRFSLPYSASIRVNRVVSIYRTIQWSPYACCSEKKDHTLTPLCREETSHAIVPIESSHGSCS